MAEATLVPEEGLSALLGESPSGAWTLRIRDDAAGSTGTLSGWTLHLTTCSCAASFAASPLRVDEHAPGAASNLNGVLEPGEVADVETSWSNAGATPFTLVTYASNFGGPAGPTYQFVDTGAAYGTVDPLSTSNCYDATGDCYRVRVTGTRPAAHWDATFDEITAPIALTEAEPYYQTWTIHVGGELRGRPGHRSFLSVHRNALPHRGDRRRTCGGLLSAGFRARASRWRCSFSSRRRARLTFRRPPPASSATFGWPTRSPPGSRSSTGRGIAAGCEPPRSSTARHRPSNASRWPVFLLKTLLGSSYMPPAAVGHLPRRPVANPFAPWIEDLYSRGASRRAAAAGQLLSRPTSTPAARWRCS